MKALRDEELLTLIARGDSYALEEVYSRYASAVFSMARYMLREPALAEEVTQEVFISVWRKAASYHPMRGAPKSWLMSVAHHRVIDQIRRRRRSPVTTSEGEDELMWQNLVSPASTEEQAHANLEREQVLESLKSLPDEQRQVVLLSYYKGYSHSEIAEKLGLPLGTVKTRLRLALQKLRASRVSREGS